MILKRNLYDNCIILNKQGQIFARATTSKCNWYLERNLANKVSSNPLTIQLLFHTNKEGSIGDEYMLSAKENKCVVCGTSKKLTRHHIVPDCYRKYICRKLNNPLNTFDILPVCFDDHSKYEQYAHKIKRLLIKKFKISHIEFSRTRNKELGIIKGHARALILHSEVMPHDRRMIMLKVIEAYLQKPPTWEDLRKLERINIYSYPKNYESAGHYIVENHSNLNRFTRFWRRHFLMTMRPKFMPEGYNYRRDAYGKPCIV
jgi:exonuclease 3'-5' domain-containing protein 2